VNYGGRKKWESGKYPESPEFTSAGSIRINVERRLLTTGVTVLFPVSNNLYLALQEIANTMALGGPYLRLLKRREEVT